MNRASLKALMPKTECESAALQEKGCKQQQEAVMSPRLATETWSARLRASCDYFTVKKKRLMMEDKVIEASEKKKKKKKSSVCFG